MGAGCAAMKQSIVTFSITSYSLIDKGEYLSVSLEVDVISLLPGLASPSIVATSFRPLARDSADVEGATT